VPLTTNVLERLVLTRLNRQPGLLLDYFSTLGFRAALTGVRLGVFDALEPGPATAEELARRLGTDPRGTESLLEVLTSLHYLRRRRDRYANLPTAERWLPGLRPPADRGYGTPRIDRNPRSVLLGTVCKRLQAAYMPAARGGPDGVSLAPPRRLGGGPERRRR
jgi:Dimerisation domain